MGVLKTAEKKFMVIAALMAALSFGAVHEAGAVEKGDILYSGGQTGIPLAWIKELPLGHTAIFIGFEKKPDGRVFWSLVDSVPNYFKYGGIRKANLRRFTHNFKYPYYGNRTTRKRPTREQREKIVEIALSKVGGDYNLTHLAQKGPDSYDCVGISEYIYESVGLNPTPDKLETGWGWPLTPAEQFENTVPNQPAVYTSPLQNAQDQFAEIGGSVSDSAASAPDWLEWPDSFGETASLPKALPRAAD